ncbi:MAG: glutathione S-transferase family protein [Solirubrobacteraceae bacterium]
MALKLYVVHGSHPCAAVEKALQLKGLQYSVQEWPPPLHAPVQLVLFGRRTVPALRNGAEKLVGSREIMRRLDEMVPEPRLYPAAPEQRARVEQAELWGDEEFQQVARDLIWAGLLHRSGALVSYSRRSRLPLPTVAIRISAPLIAFTERYLQHTNDDVAERRLEELPEQLDRIENWIADGTIGDPQQPNAADLQILSTVALLATVADADELLAGRRALSLARELFPHTEGELPAGTLIKPQATIE